MDDAEYEDEPMTELEEQRFREYFAGRTLTEYRVNVVIVQVESRKLIAAEVDPDGGGASFYDTVGIDADGVRWRYYTGEYIWKDGARFPIVQPAAYLRIGIDPWEKSK